MFINLASQAYESGVHAMPPEKCINLYPEPLPQTSDKAFALVMTPGLKEFTDVGPGPIRGMFQQDGKLNDNRYIVSGPSVYLVQENGTTTFLGGISTGSGRVAMAASATQLVIVSGLKAWVVDTAGSVDEITDPDFLPVTDVTFLNEFFLFTVAETGEFIFSAIGDGSDFDALDFATAESNSDDLVAIRTMQLQLVLVGRDTMEFWIPTGRSDAQFQRRPGGVIDYGAKSRDSVVQTDNTIYWVGDDNVIYRLIGGAPVEISTAPISEMLESVTDTDSIRGWAYVQRGHRFVVYDIPGHGTWAYDVSTGRWHERATQGQELYRPLSFARLFGKPLVGDRASGKVYELDTEIYTDDGGAIIRTASAYAPPLEGAGFSVANFSLDGMKGQGLETGQGSDPQVMMRYSDDGGNSWSNELWRSWGKIGKYGQKTIWRRLGRFGFRGRIFEVSFSDPINIVISGARMNDPNG